MNKLLFIAFIPIMIVLMILILPILLTLLILPYLWIVSEAIFDIITKIDSWWWNLKNK